MPEPTPERKKSLGELIERMEKGFDENMLDPLLESIYKEDENGTPDPEPLPSESKVTFKEKKYAVIKVPGVSSSKNSVAAGLSSRIGSTFTAAARARRADREAGGAEKDNFFYLKKAAAFNFGGDKIARTKGRFSKSPQAYQDPALSKDERFTARVKPFIGAAAPEKSGGSGENIGKNVSDAFSRLGQSFDGWWDNKYEVLEEISEISNTTSQITVENIEENNKLQEDNNTLQKKLVQVIAKQREEEDAAQKEARMEAQSRMTRTSGYSWGREKKGKKDDDDGGGGGNWMRKLRRLRKFGRRIRNPKKTFQALKRLGKQKLKKIPGVKQVNNFMKNKKPLQGLRNMFGGNKAKNAAKVADTAGDAAKGGGILSKFGGLKSGLGTLARSPLGRFGGRAMIGLGTLAGIATTKDRIAKMNDPEFQKMVQAKRDRGEILSSDEQYANPFGVATGAASAIPALGLPVIAGEMLGNSRMVQQRGIDLADNRKNRVNNVLDGIGISSTYKGGSLMPSDGSIPTITQGRDNRNIFQKMGDGYNNFVYGTQKMASGGVMAGEAGPESIFDLESVMGRKVTDKASTVENSALAAAPFILGISRKVLETSGVGTETIKSFYEQQVAPLERMFGVSNFSIRSDVGKGVDQAQKASTGSVGGFDLGGLLGGIGSMLGSLFGGPAQAATPGGGAMGATLSGTAADRVGNDPEFLQEVTRLSQKYQIKEGDLLGLMASESGLDPKSDNGKGFVGLIQFSADSAAAVGTTQAALKSMTRAQQMKYVEKYFDYWKLPKGASAGQLYATVFAPAYASKDDSTVLYSSPSEAYRGNKPLDSNGDGTITVGEMGGRIEKKKKEFGIADSGIRQQPPAQNAAQQLPAAPAPAPTNNGHEHNQMPGPINPMPFTFTAQPVATPPPVMPLPVVADKSAGAQVIPFNVGGVQGYTTKTQGFEGREVTKTYDMRGNRYPSFQALHKARLQMQ
jgi:regulator of replication initiation timing